MPVDSSTHNLLISVTENNDQPAAPDYMEEVLRKSKELDPMDVDDVAYWISARLNMAAVPVKIKALTLIKTILERGGPKLALSLKLQAMPVAQHATTFTCPPDPQYGDKPMMMVRKLSVEMLGLLGGLNEKKMLKEADKIAKQLMKERQRKARMGQEEDGYDLSPFVTEKWKPPAALHFGEPEPAIEEGVPPSQFGAPPQQQFGAPQQQFGAEPDLSLQPEQPEQGQGQGQEQEQDGVGVFMDVTSPDGQLGQQRFEIKKTETMGQVKRRMSVTMGVSPEEMAVLMGMGNDSSLDDKTVAEAGIIKEGTSLKLPAKEGFAQCQYRGKGKFIPLNLKLTKGKLEFLNNQDNSYMRDANVFGCTVTQPKSSRKGHKQCLRLDLETPDSEGESKFILSLLSSTDLEEWKEALLAYSTLDEVAAAMMEEDEEEEEEEEEEQVYEAPEAQARMGGEELASGAAASSEPAVAAPPRVVQHDGPAFSVEMVKDALQVAEKVTADIDKMVARGCAALADAHSKILGAVPEVDSTKKGSARRKLAELRPTLEPAETETIQAWQATLQSAQSALAALGAEGKKEEKEVAPIVEQVEQALTAVGPALARVSEQENQGAARIAQAVDRAANHSDLPFWVGGAEQQTAFNEAGLKARDLAKSGKGGEACSELVEALRIALRAVVAGGGTRIGARQSSLHPQRWVGELEGVDPWDVDSDDEYEN